MKAKYRLLAAGSAILIFASGASVGGVLLQPAKKTVQPTIAAAPLKPRVQVVHRTRVRHVMVRPKKSNAPSAATSGAVAPPAPAVSAPPPARVQPVSTYKPKPTSRTSPGGGGAGGHEADDGGEYGDGGGGDD